MAMAVVFSAATSYGLFMDVIVNIVVNTSQCLSKLRHSDVIILSRKYFFKMLPNISVLEWLGEGGFPKLPPPSSNSLSCHHLGFMRQTILRGGGGGGGGGSQGLDARLRISLLVLLCRYWAYGDKQLPQGMGTG